MADRTPPADLVDRLTERAWTLTRRTFEDHPDGLIEPFVRAQVEAELNFLTWLTEWATGPDGTVALIDPSTWTRVRADEVDRWWDPVEGEIVRTCVFSHHVPLYTLTREDHADPT